jgi:hypothetical protein
MTLNDLIEEVKDNTEYLCTTDEDLVECIGIENLEGILTRYFNKTIKLTDDGN